MPDSGAVPGPLDSQSRSLAASNDRARLALRRVAEGDARGLAVLYDESGPVIYGLAFRMLGDEQDAEDVVRNTFTYVWRCASDYDATRATVNGWLLLVTRCCAVDRLRARRANGGAVSAEGPPDMSPASMIRPDCVLIHDDQIARVRQEIDALPAPQREALELAYFHGLTHVEVAERLAEPTGTVKTWVRGGLRAVRAVFNSSATRPTGGPT